ncbi:hypothetical protein LTR56_021073 [Elasticomyces elasticus]|nr:hypothetical protein LTR56_021073 [Elasticomyces elasticus]KAK3635286.1 hypothetical protein LTR22_019282 [Elasticomyces elasticus]KAK4911656.1 hypothetical protein LTR49_019820 [Elasticomyces elasticus]KAK5748931.1 hypothetical protein LTS12_021036 [Elasticomyces elasticus]
MPSFDQFRVPESPPGPPQPPFWRTSNLDDLVGLQSDEKATPSLISLPTELLRQICKYIHAKKDMANLCALGSYRLFAITLPLLYETMIFEIGGTLQSRIKKMLTPENTGLQHIRYIKFIANPYDGHDTSAHQWLEMILNMIPKNILKRLSWIVPRPLPGTTSHLLWQRQSKLQNIEVFPQYVDQSDEAPANHQSDLVEHINTHELSGATELRVVPGDTNGALIGSTILGTARITDLTVDARLWSEGSAHHDPDTGYIIDPLTSALFVHISPAPLGHVGTVNTITKLALSDVDLRFAAHNWFRHLDMAKLTDLRLEYCANADMFLGTLSTNIMRPCMKNLTVVHDLGTPADRTVDMLEDLLMYTKPTLKTLEICLRNASRLPSVASVKRHASLRRLYLDVTNHSPGTRLGGNTPWIYGEEDLEALLDDCAEILHLGLHLPASSFEYKSFPRSETAFKRSLDIIINQLCDLHTLNILNWPQEYQGQNYQGVDYYASRTCQLSRLAGDIFLRFRHFDWNTHSFIKDDLGCNLEIVSFGVHEYNSYQPSPKHFVESVVTSLGRTRRTAELQELRALVHEDLETDNIEYEARRWYNNERTAFHTYGHNDDVDEADY